MKFIKKTTLLTLGFFCFFTTACNRANESTSSKISIQLPLGATSSKPGSDGITGLSAGEIFPLPPAIDTTGDDKWTGSAPTSIADINCYMVAISGPEAKLNRNSCVKKAAATASAHPLFFGPIVGGVPKDVGSLDIEVTAGPDRIIYLIGMHADDTASCTDYRSANFDESKISKRYLIGKSDKINLKPTSGTDSTLVSVTMAFVASDYYDDCSGPEFDNLADGRVATTAVLRMTAFPQKYTAATLCNSIDVNLQDQYARPAHLTNVTSIGLTIKDTAGAAGSVTALPSYSTFTECLGFHESTGPVGDTYFNIPADTVTAKRWFIAPLSSHTQIDLLLDLTKSTLAQEKVIQTLGVNNNISTTEILDITGPTNVIKDVCYKYEAGKRDLMGAYAGTSTTGLSFAGSEANIYGASTCGGVPIPALNGTTYPNTFYVKFTSTGRKSLHLSGSGGQLGEKEVNVFPADESTIPTKVEISENRIYPNVGLKCYGPFHLALRNQNNLEVNNPEPTRSYTVTGAPTRMIIHQGGCAGAVINGVSSAQLYSGQSNFIFYFEILDPPPDSGTNTLHFTDSNPLHKDYDFTFTLN